MWRHSGIGAGRAAGDVLATPNRLVGWTNVRQRALVWEADGIESSVALVLDNTGYVFIVNGKSDGAARGDSGTQVMLGLVGALTTPNPRRALVIGLGTGSSAGWLAAMPGMERVDVVELEPLILDVARASVAVNHDVMNNPKVHVTIADAREALLTSTSRYDLIASEPSNPFRAGIASLFTLDYYRAASDRLTDDGVFVQWVQGYEIDGRTLQTVYATMAAVFPQIDTWQTQRRDLLLVGSKRRHAYSARALAARIAEPPFKQALANTWRAVDLNGVLGHYLANDTLARAFATADHVELNTDDRNVVEFGLARSVGRAECVRDRGSAAACRRVECRPSDARRRDRHQLGRGGHGVDHGQRGAGIVRGVRPAAASRRAGAAALDATDENGEIAAARQAWPPNADPRDPNELAMLADVEAEVASDAALPLIEKLRVYQPGEADVLLAKLRLRQSRRADAASALESAFTRFRTDPWPTTRLKQGAVDMAQIVVSGATSRWRAGCSRPSASRSRCAPSTTAA